MRLLTNAVAAMLMLFASVSANAALTSTTDGTGGSVLFSIWQDGVAFDGMNAGTASSLVVDTGFTYSDLFNLGGGASLQVNINNTIPGILGGSVAGWFTSSLLAGQGTMLMNVAAAGTDGTNNGLFSSVDTFNNGIGVTNGKLTNSVSTYNDLSDLIDDYTATTLDTNDANASQASWLDDFGTTFPELDNALEVSNSTPMTYDGVASGDMILFSTNTAQSLPGNPLSVNDFGQLFSVTFDIATGLLTLTNNGAAAVPLPAAVWFLGSALLGLLGFSRRNAQAAA